MQHATLDLLYGLTADGATVARRSLAAPPLQLSRLRRDDPADPARACHTLMQLGGVLAGDSATLDVVLEADARASVTAAAATQVYRMPQGAARWDLTIRLGERAELAWLMQPTILFADSEFRQTTTVILGAGARLTLLDVLVPGRLARGERFAFRRYESRFEVLSADGRLLAAERTLLTPETMPLGRRGLFGARPAIGSAWILGDSVDAATVTAAVAGGTDEAGATELPNRAGALIRAADMGGWAVRQTLLRAIGQSSMYHADDRA